MSRGLQIVVLGYIVRGPLGGLAWHHLQYVLGLVELGHKVVFIEDSDDFASCYDPSRHTTDVDPTFGLQFLSKAFQDLNLSERWGYHDAHQNRWHGPLGDEAEVTCRSADVLINVSGVNPLRAWLEDVPHRVFVDTDPVFTQIRHLTEVDARELAEKHTHFFSFGENIRGKQCSVPDDGFHWQATRQPVVLSAWPVTDGKMDGRFTTVMQWDSYACRNYNDFHYGMKSESFKPFFELPSLSDEKLELALGSDTAPRDELVRAGWMLRNPLEVTEDPWRYQEYLKESKGEFSIAKHGYVITRSGWFSERTACYLASGRPAVVQDTGFTDWLRSEGGVLPFTDPEEAIAALEEVNKNYDKHCRLARLVAEEYFDSDRVLRDLLDRVLS